MNALQWTLETIHVLLVFRLGETMKNIFRQFERTFQRMLKNIVSESNFILFYNKYFSLCIKIKLQKLYGLYPSNGFISTDSIKLTPLYLYKKREAARSPK